MLIPSLITASFQSEAPLNGLNTPTFATWDPLDPRVVTNFNFEPSVVRPSILIHASAIQLTNGGVSDVPGEAREIAICSDKQDTLDLLPHFHDGVQHRFVLYETPRPVVNATNILHLPGAFLSEKLGGAETDRTVDHMLTTRLDLKRSTPPRLLGGNYLTSPSLHSEAVVLMSVETSPLNPDQHDMAWYSRDASRPFIRRMALSLPELFARFEADPIRDSRALDAVLRFCEQKDLEVPAVKLASLLRGKLLSEHVNTDIPRVSVRITSYEEARTIALQARKTIATVIKTEPASFLSTSAVLVTNNNSEGVPISQWTMEVITANTPHSLDFIPWCMIEGEPYVMLKHQVVNGAIARKEFPHILHGDFPAQVFCGLSGFTKDSLSANTVKRAAGPLLDRLLGIKSFDTSRIIFENPETVSPAYSNEITRKAYFQLTASDLAQLPSDTHLIKLQDAKQLINEGLVPDHRFSGGIRLLEAALLQSEFVHPEKYSSKSQEFTDFTDEELQEFDRVITSGSPLHYVLSRISPELHQLCMAKSETYRKTLAFAVNERGLVPAALGGAEDVFFRAGVPIFTVYQRGNNHAHVNEFAGNGAHDASHHCMGDFVPLSLTPDGKRLLRDELNQPITCSIEHFTHMVTEAEVKAVAISDSIIPSEIGLDDASRLTWRGKIASALHAIGIPSDRAAEEIRTIELDGIIPVSLLNSPAYQSNPAIQDSIRKLVYFGVLDTLQLKIFYKNWCENPIIVETLLRLGTVTSNSKEYYQRIKNLESEIRNSPEGINALKAENAAFSTAEIMIPALRLSFVAQAVQRIGGDTSLIYQDIDTLVVLYREMQNVRAEIGHTNKTTENLMARKELENARTIIRDQITPLLETCALDFDMMSADDRKEFNELLLPGFVSQMGFDPNLAKRMTQERIDRSLMLAGL